MKFTKSKKPLPMHARRPLTFHEMSFIGEKSSESLMVRPLYYPGEGKAIKITASLPSCRAKCRVLLSQSGKNPHFLRTFRLSVKKRLQRSLTYGKIKPNHTVWRSFCMKKIFLSAILAGAVIAFGGTVFLSVENTVVGSLFFTIGLFVVCTRGLHLFTGKVCYVFDNDMAYAKTLPVIWLGNLAGTSLIALVASIARQARGSYTMAEKGKWTGLVLTMGSLAFVLGLILIFAYWDHPINFVGFVLIGLALICWSISSKVILLAKIWHADFPLANRIPIIPVLTALACLFLAAFLYEEAAFQAKFFVPARVLSGFGAICFTLYSIVSILESGTSKK